MSLIIRNSPSIRLPVGCTPPDRVEQMMPQWSTTTSILPLQPHIPSFISLILCRRHHRRAHHPYTDRLQPLPAPNNLIQPPSTTRSRAAAVARGDVPLMPVSEFRSGIPQVGDGQWGCSGPRWIAALDLVQGGEQRRDVWLEHGRAQCVVNLSWTLCCGRGNVAMWRNSLGQYVPSHTYKRPFARKPDRRRTELQIQQLS